MKIVVDGAGVAGLSCAYELIQDGHEVTVLDSSAAGQGVSHGNAAKVAIGEASPVPAPGMVVQGLKWMLRPDSPLYVRPSLSPPFVRCMVQLARNCTESQFRTGLNVNLQPAESANPSFDEWRSAGLRFEMHERGNVLAYEDPRQFEDRLRYREVWDASGAKAEVLDEAGVREVEPALSDRVTRGIFFPGDRQIEPDSLTRALMEQVERSDATMPRPARKISSMSPTCAYRWRPWRLCIWPSTPTVPAWPDSSPLCRSTLRPSRPATRWPPESPISIFIAPSGRGRRTRWSSGSGPWWSRRYGPRCGSTRRARANPERDADLHRRLIDVTEAGHEDKIIAEVKAHIGVSLDEIIKRIDADQQ